MNSPKHYQHEFLAIQQEINSLSSTNNTTSIDSTAQSIRNKLNNIKNELELLKQKKVSIEVDEELALIDVLLGNLRREILKCKNRKGKEKETMMSSEKEMLLAGASQHLLSRQRTMNNNHPASGTSLSQSATQQMRQTLRIFQTQIEASTEANSILSQSSSLLVRTQGSYSSFTGLVGKGRQLLRKLGSRDRVDRILIAFAFFVYLLVVLYILKKRSLFGSILDYFFGY